MCWLGQIAENEFALDLQAHHEEEHGHQAVVDQMNQRKVHRPAAKGQADLAMPKLQIPRGSVSSGHT